MSSQWESTTLLRVAEQAYIRDEILDNGRQSQDLVECQACHRTTDWLISAAGSGVEFTCRCGRRWSVAVELHSVVGLAEFQPIEPRWMSLDDAGRALGYHRRPVEAGIGGPRRRPIRLLHERRRPRPTC